MEFIIVKWITVSSGLVPSGTMAYAVAVLYLIINILTLASLLPAVESSLSMWHVCE